MHTRNLDEAIEAVTKIYCPHTIEVNGPVRNVDARLEVVNSLSQALIKLSYSAPVKIDAQDFSGLFLMMGCSRGSAFATQEHRTAEWRQGQTMPFSAGFDTKLLFDQEFVQTSVRLDMKKLEILCAGWLGRPLEQPLRFALRPFSENLEQVWQRTLLYLRSLDEGGSPLTGAARAAFDEFLLTLLLHQHPHNYSDEIANPVPVPIPRLVRRAERFMTDNAAEQITVSDVAAEAGVSLRSLQAGFRQWRGTTPHAFLRHTRLQLVHDELLRSGKEANVTAVALSHGFSHLGRFSALYHSTFGELPSTTLRWGKTSSRERKAG